MNYYEANIQFEPITLRIKAKNMREAKRKMKERLAKKDSSKLIDKGNTSINHVASDYDFN